MKERHRIGRWLIAALLVALPLPALAAPSAAARAFAAAWVDQDTVTTVARQSLASKIDTCVKNGMIAPEVLGAEQPLLELYLNTFLDGLGRVQDKVAVQAQTLLSNADLATLAQTFSSPAFRAMRRQVLPGMMTKLVPAIPGCGDDGKPVKLSELSAGALPRMTQPQLMALRRLAISPAGQHFSRAMPQLTATMTAAFRDEVQVAMQAVGASPEAQSRVRAVPSPVIVDAPPTHR